jgi:putative ABC transport system permease protein
MSELRQTLRALRERPGWTATIVLTLALGIGADTTLFTYLCATLWPTLDAPGPERVVDLYSGTAEDPDEPPSYPDWRDYRERSGVFERLAASRLFAASVVSRGTSAFAWGTLVTGDYFPLFDKPPRLGRWLGPQDDRPGAPAVMVLGGPFWRHQFGADPEIVGKTVSLDGRHAYTVVGVMPPGFQADGLPFSIYLPMARWRDVVTGLDRRDGGRVAALGRLRPGISREAAEQAVAAVARGLDESAPLARPRRVSLLPAASLEARVGEGVVDPLVRRAEILTAVVGLLLLLAAANVANLLLARVLARRRELGVRAALGAGRWRLARGAALESLLLALAGGTAGTGLAWLGSRWLEPILHQTNPVGFGSWGEGARVLVFDGRMLVFAFVLAAATAALVSLAPAFVISRAGPLEALRAESGGRGRSGGTRRLLVVAQVALALVLLVVAGLLVRSLASIEGIDPGFDTRGLFLASLYLPEDAPGSGAGAGEASRQVDRFAELVRRLGALPEVASAGLVARPPLFGGAYPDQVALDGGAEGGEPFPVSGDMVGPGYFATLGLSILRGRGFTAADGPEAPGVAVVNQTFARHHLAGKDPIGRRVTLAGDASPRDRGRSFEIVGVVADSRYSSLMDPPSSMVYYAAAQRPRKRMTLVLRARAAAAEAGLGETVRRVLHREHPEVSVVELVPFEAQIRRSLFEQRLQVRLATAVGLLGLLLASAGLAAVVAYSVRRRRREIAVRMALGARLEDAVSLVLRDSVAVVALGLVLGLVVALALGKVVESLLFGVAPWDLPSLAGGAALLAATTLAASWLPARRAARVDPAGVLKEE